MPRGAPTRSRTLPRCQGPNCCSLDVGDHAEFARVAITPRGPVCPSQLGAFQVRSELTFHGLRHCAGSLWLAAGVDISIVSKLLGHSSISVTADIYAHMLKGVGQRAVDGAAALIALTVHSQQAVSA